LFVFCFVPNLLGIYDAFWHDTLFVFICFFCCQPSFQMFMVAVAIFGPSSLVLPAVTGILSNRVGDSEQGLLQGAISALSSVSSVMGNALFTTLFGIGKTKLNMPQFPFFFAFGFIAFAFVCTLVMARYIREDEAANGTQPETVPAHSRII
jgi:MFS family permease